MANVCCTICVTHIYKPTSLISTEFNHKNSEWIKTITIKLEISFKFKVDHHTGWTAKMDHTHVRMPVRLLSSYNLHWAVTLTTFHPLHLSPLLWAAMWECNPCAFTHSVQLLFIHAREEVSPVRYGLLDYCESSASHPRGWSMCEAVELHSSNRPPKSGVHLSGGFTCFKFVVALSCWWPVIHSLLEFPLTGIVIKYLFLRLDEF